MDILLKSVRIVDAGSSLNGKTRDILIINGKIKSIAAKIEDSDLDGSVKVLQARKACVSIGWMDMHANFRDPGQEYKEDISSGLKAAAAGGFTAVALMPSTTPPIQTKSDIEYLLTKSKNSLVDVYPVGSLSVDRKGNDLAELYDMYQSGAVAFSDDKHPVNDSGLLTRALLYTKTFNSPVISFASDEKLAGKSLMNESVNSTMIGIKGSPAVAEEVMVARDIKICEYTGGRVHFATISTPGSLSLIKQAKSKGLNVTCEVAAHYIALDDSMLNEFDTNLKVKPPLRSKPEVNAIKKAIADGTVDVICSDHSPQDVENKEVEYDFAAFGIIGLETAFAVAHTALSESVDITQLIEKMTVNPRKILNIPIPVIAEDEPANLTIFDPDMTWTFTEDDIRSKSKNSPFIGKELTGKPIAVINNNKFFEI